VTHPAKDGFGSILIEHGLGDVGVRREFFPEGLLCTVDIALPAAI
jgi:hypothetical protein